MKHAVPHDLSMESAKQAASSALEAYKARFAEHNPTISWVKDNLAEVSFKAKGVGMKGTFEILSDRIEMDMEVPFLLRMFKQKAIDVVEGEIRKWVAKAKDGQL
jgi:hypothetical protein